MTPGWMPFIIAMASMDENGIYEDCRRRCRLSRRWHLWRNMASMTGTTQMRSLVAMASMDQHGIYVLARPIVPMRTTVVAVVRMIMIAVIVMMMVGGSMR